MIEPCPSYTTALIFAAMGDVGTSDPSIPLRRGALPTDISRDNFAPYT